MSDIDPELLKRAQVEAELVKKNKKKLYMIERSHSLRGVETFDLFPLNESDAQNEKHLRVITIEEAEELKDDPRCKNKKAAEALLYALKELEDER